MLVLILAPVELPARIGPQFVESAIERIVETEGTVALPLGETDEVALNKVAVLVPQLGIEQAAQVGGAPRVAASHVRLEVERVAGKVTGVVHVDEDLLLRHGTPEVFQIVLPALERGGQVAADGSTVRKHREVPSAGIVGLLRADL